MSSTGVANLTVSQLKEKLREMDLSVTGNKKELIERLLEADLSNECSKDTSMTLEASRVEEDEADRDSECSQIESLYRRELEVCQREKKAAERELQLARREIELMKEEQRQREIAANREEQRQREIAANREEQRQQEIAANREEQRQRGGVVSREDRRVITTREEDTWNNSKVSIKAISELLNFFEGGAHEDYVNWEKQLTLLKTAHHLPNEHVKILIGMKLRGKALEWLHSRAEHIELSVEALLAKLREMYDHRPSTVVLRRQFEERMWKKSETFHEYVHDKIILANKVPIDESEVIDYIIEGIPITNLRDQARIGTFTTKASLLQAFEKVSLRDKVLSDNGQQQFKKFEKPKMTSDGQRRRYRDKKEIKSESEIRCFNCGERDHVSANCPSKEEGPKCFQCGERGHIASRCAQKKKAVRNICTNAFTSSKKCCKEVEIDGNKFIALIDTGSDISLMRADAYIKLKAPPLKLSQIKFRGVGSSDNTTLGELNIDLTIDGCIYPVPIHVVSDTLLNYSMLLGADFIKRVKIVMIGGDTSIIPLEQSSASEDVPEIYQIDINSEHVNNVDVSHVSDEKHREKIKDLVNSYNPNRSREIEYKMTITLKDEEPVYQRARRLSVLEREQVNKQIDEWIRDGIVQPSLSEFASPVVLVKKKDGTVRLCVDYRQLNQKIIKDRYPLPLIEDQLDQLQSARFFSTLDLKNGFFHVAVDERSRKYTAFIVPDGHYEFLRVPFGLCNPPAVFQRFINIVFRDLIHAKIVLTYMDDLIIPSVNHESGLKSLKTVLRVASEAGLIINWKKCSFLKNRVEFLGHIIEDGRVYPSERKIEAVQKFPEPRNIKQIQSFLGLSGYFRKFVLRYSIIARPLSNLLRANATFVFGDNERRAFLELKEILSTKPVLNLYKHKAVTELHTDASIHGFGAILMQKGDDNAFHPVYYYSSKTTEAEKKYTSYELEVLAIVKALKRFRVYLITLEKFTIVTDCQAFDATMRKKDLCVRVARWALLLEEFPFETEHRPGTKMAHVDALSRYPLPVCNLIERQENGITARLKRAQCEDDDVRKIFELAKLRNINGYIIRGGLLFKEGDGDVRIVVPKSMQSQIIRHAHERGHFSIAKTEDLLRKDYWIPDAKQKIEKIIRNCIACILAERKRGKREGYLNPIAKGEVPLDTYHIDHLGPLPSTKKNFKHIFVVVDSFSKFTWLYATKTTNAAEVVNRLEKQSVIFGNPHRIISDRGTAFTSAEFSDYCAKEGIKHVLTTTGIPRANGQVERMNRTLIPVLTKLADPKREEWYKYLETTQKCINTTVSRSTGMTPFKLLFGVHARLIDEPEIKRFLEDEWIETFQDDREELRKQAMENILKVQTENKHQFNKKRISAKKYRSGDLVAIKRTQQGPGLKLATKYLGPYQVINALRNDRYIVQREGNHEGPLRTSTAADYMKPWVQDLSDDDDECED